MYTVTVWLEDDAELGLLVDRMFKPGGAINPCPFQRIDINKIETREIKGGCIETVYGPDGQVIKRGTI